jgi:hypothetical protein
MKQTIYSLRQEWLNKHDQLREAILAEDFDRARVLKIEGDLAYNTYLRLEKALDRDINKAKTQKLQVSLALGDA